MFITAYTTTLINSMLVASTTWMESTTLAASHYTTAHTHTYIKTRKHIPHANTHIYRHTHQVPVTGVAADLSHINNGCEVILIYFTNNRTQEEFAT
jgi:hypothetical protein